MRFVFALLLLAALGVGIASPFPRGGAGQPQVTILNADSNGNNILHHDTTNNAMAMHSMSVMQVGSTIYMYSETYACGFILGTTSPWCGFNVYNFTDPTNPIFLGKLFDPTTSYWQNRCSATSTGISGCYGASMVYNAANNNYVFWFNQQGGSPASAQGEFVFTCTTPWGFAVGGPAGVTPGTCTQQADPSHLVHGPVEDSTILFVDTDGTGYGLYSHVNGSQEMYIDKLNSTYTDSLGTLSADTGVQQETGTISLRNGVYMVTYGANGVYTPASAGITYSTTGVLGTYSGATVLNATACGGQQNGIYTLSTPAGVQYVWGSNQWTSGTPNESLASQILVNMTFTGSSANAITCPASTIIPGLTPNPPAAPSPAPDQTSVQDRYSTLCDTNGTLWNMQTFVPTTTPLTKVYFDLFQQCGYSSGCGGGVTVNLTVSLYAVDGSHNPTGSALATSTVSYSTVQWAPTWTDIPLSYANTPGTEYAVVFSAPSLASDGSQGCYGRYVYQGGAPGPYTAGVQKHSANSGSTWTPLTNGALMFSSFGP